MKRWLVLLVCLGFFFPVAAQDSLVMKYKYKFEYERGVAPPVIPLQQYAQVATIKNGLRGKEDTTTPHLLKLHKTWRSKKNEALGYQDFALINVANERNQHDSILFQLEQEYVEMDKEMRDWILMHERSYGIGGRIATEYWKNPRELPNPYIGCIDKDDFKYTIPVLHEVDWISLSQQTAVDTIEQKRLFFTDSTLITIRDKQWKLWEVSYCIGYNFPDTVNNTTFQWKGDEVDLPPSRPLYKSKYRAFYRVFSKKNKRIRIGRLLYIFSNPQKLFGTEDYVMECTVKDRNTTYVQNLFLGKGSQLVFHDIVLNVLVFDSDGLIVKYRSTK